MGISVVSMDSIEYAAAVANKVKQLAAERGLNLVALAAKTTIPRTTLNRRLTSNGLSPLTMREVKELANALNVNASDLTTVYATLEVPA